MAFVNGLVRELPSDHARQIKRYGRDTAQAKWRDSLTDLNSARVLLEKFDAFVVLLAATRE